MKRLRYGLVVFLAGGLFLYSGCTDTCPPKKRYENPDLVFPRPTFVISKMRVVGDTIAQDRVFYQISNQPRFLDRFNVAVLDAKGRMPSLYVGKFKQRLNREVYLLYDDYHPIHMTWGYADGKCDILLAHPRQGSERKTFYVKESALSFKLEEKINLRQQREHSEYILSLISAESEKPAFADNTADMNQLIKALVANIAFAEEFGDFDIISVNQPTSRTLFGKPGLYE